MDKNQLRVCILTLDNEVLEDKLTQLPNEKTLVALREALTSSELGKPEKEIFYPTWTHSVYIMQSSGDPSPEDFRNQEYLVKDDQKLQTLFQQVENDHKKKPVLLLQQTRARRYRNRIKTNTWREDNRQSRANWTDGNVYMQPVAVYTHYAHPSNGMGYYPAPGHHHQMFPGYAFHQSAPMGMMNMNTFYNTTSTGTPVQFDYNL